MVISSFSNSDYIQEMTAATSILKAIEDNSLRPVPSISWTGLDQRKAYHVQKRLVAAMQEKGEKIVGYKAGLTLKGAAKNFGLSSPLTGVLFQSNQINVLDEVSLKDSHRLMIEQELAFLLAVDINKQVTDVASLKGHFSYVSSALEFPDLGFLSRPNGLDIIANNAVNRYFHFGPWQSLPENLNDINVTLYCNNTVVNTGKSHDAMSDQWQALLWMVNQLQGQGYHLKKGQVLMTGNLGALIPAQLCQYRADFSELGQVIFNVVP